MKPNFIFILSDDQGAWAMHCAGNSDVITPNLDKIAAHGMRFENFFCASPVCSPARASILTGKMPSAHGVHDWISGGNVDTACFPNMKEHPGFACPDQAVPYLAGQPLWLETLAQNGYRCGLSGKWHMGNSTHAPAGMEHWAVLRGGGCGYYEGDVYEDHTFVAEQDYITDVITQRAQCMLDDFLQTPTQPFCLGIHYTAPHSPWDAANHPAQYRALYKDCTFSATPILPVHRDQICSSPIGDTPEKRKECLTGFYAAITAMDAAIGRVLKQLEANGALENTVIIFTSDNGVNMGHHGIWGKGNGTYPQNMYDTSVKVPFLIAAPCVKQQNTVCYQLANHCDLFPTILELAQLPFHRDAMQTGTSLCRLFENPTAEYAKEIAVHDEYGSVRMLRNMQYKLIENAHGGENAFYDLLLDPQELENKIDAPAYQQIVQQMQHDLTKWFLRYTCAEKDGRNFPITGRGQKKLCEEADAFEQKICYYHKERVL